MLLRCNSVCDRLNKNCLTTSRHKWLIVELKSNEQFFFSWKALYDEFEYLLFNNKITRFLKKAFQNLVLIKTW